jgi:hypothetical protein
MWVLIGALAGGAGSVGGAALAAFATPSEVPEQLESPTSWVRRAMADGVSGLWRGRNATAVLSIAGATALSAAVSGVAAWSVNEYPHEARARVLWIVNAALVLGCFARYTLCARSLCARCALPPHVSLRRTEDSHCR